MYSKAPAADSERQARELTSPLRGEPIEMSIQPLDSPVYSESYYAAAAPTTRLQSYLPTDARPLTVALVLIVAGAVKFGWELRELFALSYDYHQLAWLIPLACALVAWGNRNERA